MFENLRFTQQRFDFCWERYTMFSVYATDVKVGYSRFVWDNHAKESQSYTVTTE